MTLTLRVQVKQLDTGEGLESVQLGRKVQCMRLYGGIAGGAKAVMGSALDQRCVDWIRCHGRG